MSVDTKANNTHDMLEIVRGKQQQIWWEILTKHHVLPSPVWQSKYPDEILNSLNNMIRRAKKLGYVIERLPGPRGGESLATYRLVQYPNGEQVEIHHKRILGKQRRAELVPDTF